MKSYNYISIIVVMILFVFLSAYNLMAENSVEPNFEDSLTEDYLVEPLKSIFQNPSKIQFHLVRNYSNDSKELCYASDDEKVIKNYAGPYDPDCYYLIKKKADLDGKNIIEVKSCYEEYGMPVIKLYFNDDGKRALFELTKNYIESQLAIVIDDIAITAPRIHSPVTDGILIINYIIDGSFPRTMTTNYLTSNEQKMSFHIVEKEADSVEGIGEISNDEMILRNPIYSKKAVFYKLKKANAVSGSDILGSNSLFGSKDYIVIMIEFNDKGKTELLKLLKENIGKKLALVADNVVYSSPKITSDKIHGFVHFRIEK
ncbi:MAG: hypothetical protein IKP71_06440 [Candidatus Riflebacteria bacterium]|nr:hypothetical protein [Candidatus Riflebacteria bacterium]